MKNKIMHNHIAAIDVGTTKICVIVTEKDPHNNLKIIGVGRHPSEGLKKGVVVNINTAAESIRKAVKQAEESSGIAIESACVGISGGHIQSFNSIGVVAIKGRDVSQFDIDRVVDAAKAIPIPKQYYILHVLPQYFRVDGQEHIVDSLGMYGVRLEAQVHIITGAIASAQNIIKACELAGIGVSDIVLEQIASASAVLTSYEQKMGIGILDIGGGTSDFALYRDGRIRHSKVTPLAGNHFSHDLSIGLGIPFERAEEMKKEFGSVSLSTAILAGKKTITIPLGYENGQKDVSVSMAIEILRCRAEEIFDILSEEIYKFRLRNLMSSGIVLTGGGSLLPGIKELAEEKLSLPVRLGYPQAFAEHRIETLPEELKSPIYSTSYGLMLYAAGNHGLAEFTNGQATVFNRIAKRMKSWIYDLF